MENHRRMLAQYGQSTMNQRKVYEWVERFKSCRTRVTDEGRSGQPSTSRTQDHKSSRKASSLQEYRSQLNDMTKCIVLQGDYVEKLYVKLFTVTSIETVKCILPLLFDSPSYVSHKRNFIMLSSRLSINSYFLFTLPFLSKQTRNGRNIISFYFFLFINGRAKFLSPGQCVD